MKFLKLDIQLFAHHKGQGSTSNGRDSAGRRLGAKAADGEFITIIKSHEALFLTNERKKLCILNLMTYIIKYLD